MEEKGDGSLALKVINGLRRLNRVGKSVEQSRHLM